MPTIFGASMKMSRKECILAKVKALKEMRREGDK